MTSHITSETLSVNPRETQTLQMINVVVNVNVAATVCKDCFEQTLFSLTAVMDPCSVWRPPSFSYARCGGSSRMQPVWQNVKCT